VTCRCQDSCGSAISRSWRSLSSGRTIAGSARSRLGTAAGEQLGGFYVLESAGRRGPWHRCSCGRPIPEDVRRCSARTCPEFAPTWARDTRRRLFVNLKQLKPLVTFSVTAPGADLYPFDPRFCSHSPSQRCSAAIGCRVDPVLAAAFNRQAGK